MDGSSFCTNRWAFSGLDGFTESLRRTVAEDSIAVTLINPGLIATGMLSENAREKAEGIRDKEMLSAEDVA